MHERHLTSGQAAQRLGVAKRTLLRSMRRGEIRAATQTPGGFFRFHVADVEAYARRLARSPSSRDTERERPRRAAVGASMDGLRTLYEATSCGVLVIDASGHVVDANAAAQEMLGVSASQLREALATHRWPMVRQDGSDLPDDERPSSIALRTGRPVHGLVLGVVRPNGERRWLQTDAIPQLDDAGIPVQVVSSFVDITARRQMEEQLRAAEARYRALVEQLPTVTYISAPDTSGALVYISPQIEALLGFPPAEWLADPNLWIRLLHPDDRDHVQAAVARCAATGEPFRSEYRFRTRDGRYVWFCDEAMMVQDDNGRPLYIQGIMIDITERKQMEEALHHQALHDGLTGLPNRTLLQERLQQALWSAQRHRQAVALLLIDLDRFKEVNDTFGHRHGDVLLQQVAARMQEVLRSSDTVARLGGDEFAVVLPDAGCDGATTLAHRIVRTLAAPFVVEGQTLQIAASIGSALYPEHGADPQTLLRQADVAMYAAKRAHSGHVIYAAEHDQHSRDRLALVAALRDAIAHDGLLLYYQPKVDTTTGGVRGVEALLRWPHPQRGFIPPDQFIPLAEQTGLMEPLTEWVLNAALRQWRQWQRCGLDVAISVNLSMSNLHNKALPDALARLLHTYGVPPSRLRVELTESSIMADAKRVLEVLTRVHALGMRISVDDFGTGYSSLAYLRRLPVDELKIDRSFVQHLAEDQTDVAIVRSTIGLGHSLGLQVVAEGVENRETLDMLAGLGCDALQGYYLSHPLPAADLARWLRDAQPAVA